MEPMFTLYQIQEALSIMQIKVNTQSENITADMIDYKKVKSLYFHEMHCLCYKML